MKHMTIEAAESRRWTNYRTGETTTEGELRTRYVDAMRAYNATHNAGYFGSFGSWTCHNRWDRAQ